MGTLWREALEALCGGNRWCYAVFWKIGLQNPKLLIWEESYTRSPTSNIPRFPQNETAIHFQTEEKAHLLVNKMMMENHINIVGEGLVGRVAFTREHQWILSENFYRETHPPEVLKELSQQFSAGMKTVVVVPVLPHGVVQFGSFLSLTEEERFIRDVKSMIHQLGNVVHGGLLAENYAPKASSSSMKFNTNLETQMSHQSASHHISGVSRSPHLPSTSVQNLFVPSEISPGNLMPELDKAGGFKVERALDIPLTRQDEQHFSTKSELITDYSYYNPDDTYVMPPSGDDLFDVLGADFKNKLFGGCNNNTLSNASSSCIFRCDCQTLPCNKNVASSSSSSVPHYSTSLANSDSTIFASNGAEQHLLDAVISNVSSQGAKVPSTSLPYGVLEGLSVQKSTLKDEASKEETQTLSQGSSICGSSQLSSWLNGDQKGSSSASTGHSKKPEGTGKTNRKRLKPGENPRPRPKDRQMIQDRVKELREIVPSGAKCSIDALLERTIKHMLFLESVTKHADKLRQTGDSKILSRDGGLVLKGNPGGATWAYEVGSQSSVCPIIVEDLNQPRQMLVEMLCEERGLFLEIADIIRGMGLTILRGVMETRSNKIWARFVVEANRDVTRMEIFVSLVHLLEQSAKNSLAQGNNIIVSEKT